jgi:hypothetical protein
LQYVRPQWIVHSVGEGKRLEECNYLPLNHWERQKEGERRGMKSFLSGSTKAPEVIDLVSPEKDVGSVASTSLSALILLSTNEATSSSSSSSSSSTCCFLSNSSNLVGIEGLSKSSNLVYLDSLQKLVDHLQWSSSKISAFFDCCVLNSIQIDDELLLNTTKLFGYWLLDQDCLEQVRMLQSFVFN